MTDPRNAAYQVVLRVGPRATWSRAARVKVFTELSQPDMGVVVGPVVMQEDFAIVDWTRGSFSGGRTSAYMLWRALQAYGGKLPNSHAVVFANTGLEHEETLKFINRCAVEFKVNVVWVEAKTHHNQRLSSGYRIVSFETANRDGAPFEDMIRKYGIPNKGYPHCNRELKLAAIASYLEDVWDWPIGSYQSAIGIRCDEADRVSETAETRGIVYPLVKAFVRQSDVYSFWKRQPFDLYLPEHLGNCTFCWKKSLRKHLTLAVDHPEVFDFPRRMEALYGMQRPERGRQVFFRNSTSVEDIFARAALPFERFVDGREVFDPELDASGGACGEESCEIFSDGDLFPIRRRAA